MKMTTKIFRSTFRSDEEYWFACWLQNLQDAGLVQEWAYEDLTQPLTDCPMPAKVEWFKELKTKWKPMRKTMIRTKHGSSTISYTPDFRVVWNRNAEGVVMWMESGVYKKLPPLYADKLYDVPLGPNGFKGFKAESLIEIKGGYDPYNSEEASRLRIAVMHDITGRIVNVVRPEADIFKKTFCPTQYLITGKNKWRRKKVKGKMVPVKDLPWTRNCEEFLRGM